jgi:hypothetical protein
MYPSQLEKGVYGLVIDLLNLLVQEEQPSLVQETWKNLPSFPWGLFVPLQEFLPDPTDQL